MVPVRMGHTHPAERPEVWRSCGLGRALDIDLWPIDLAM